MAEISGREAERQQLGELLNSKEAELLAIFGRRRVGKTYLIRNVYEKQLLFSFTGVHNGTLRQQLELFQVSLSEVAGIKVALPEGWIDAFQTLKELIEPKLGRTKTVVFFDEFPWINTPRSGFLNAFDHFWNDWAVRKPNLIVVICGSAASWMIKEIINAKGGLHNRVTRKIRLLPFTVSETETYLQTRGTRLDRYQLLQMYMALGGIPQYLKEIRKGESAAQNIDRICFAKDGFLHEEFKNLFYALFDKADRHMAIIRALSKKGKGLTRTELIVAGNLPSGGGATNVLEELSQSGFITPYIPFDRTAKDTVYRLSDEYCAFYIRFIESAKFSGAGSWLKFSQTATWKTWSGFAFEGICMKHSDQIKKGLGISGVHTEISVWRTRGSQQESGAQIDLLIDRQDRCINICEMKYSIDKFELTKAYVKQLEEKKMVFRSETKTKKTLFLTIVTTFGLKNSDNYTGVIQSDLTMDVLF